MAQNFEDCRRKWLVAEEDLTSCKEVLTKTQTERSSLEVKLKHARNQVDVEIRRRQKAEADCDKLVCVCVWTVERLFAMTCSFCLSRNVFEWCFFLNFAISVGCRTVRFS